MATNKRKRHASKSKSKSKSEPEYRSEPESSSSDNQQNSGTPSPPSSPPSKQPTTTKQPLATSQSSSDSDSPVSKLNSNSPEPKSKSNEQVSKKLFNEEDEVRILEGLIEFKEDNDRYGSIIKNLDVRVEKGQVIDKVRRLKRKFTQICKSKVGIVLKDHEKVLFDLSKKIWDVNTDNVVKRDKMEGDDDVEMEVNFEVGEAEGKKLMKAKALKLMGKKGRDEIKEMWRKVEMAQLEVDLMRYEARVQENRMIMEALGLLV